MKIRNFFILFVLVSGCWAETTGSLVKVTEHHDGTLWVTHEVNERVGMSCDNGPKWSVESIVPCEEADIPEDIIACENNGWVAPDCEDCELD